GETFAPAQFDNLNVGETSGRNSRTAFPSRRINKLRDVPPAERSADGMLTYVYHLFPNAMVATFPTNVVMVVIEPLAIDRTRLLTYALTDRRDDDVDGRAALKGAQGFVEAGAAQGPAGGFALPQGLPPGAN